MSELVSVVIPSYNYGRYVEEAVESALAQTYGPMEVIVVDDGSTDDTAERLKKYLGRINYIYQKNQGLSAARNTGIRNARGEWVALLDSDDKWHARKTEVQLAAVGGDETIGFVGSPECAEIASELPDQTAVCSLGVREFLTKAPIAPSSVMIRRNCFDRVGFFDESLRSVEDRDMWLRLAARYRALQVCSPCWSYRYHPGQMNRNADRMFANYKQVLVRFFKDHPGHRDLYQLGMGHLYMDAAWSYLAEGRKRTALARLMQSFWHRPLRVDYGRADSRFLRLKMAMRILIGGSSKALASS